MKNLDKIVDKTIAKVGKSITLGAPLGAGKPNHLINAFYRRAKKDKSITLRIATALTLEKPKGNSLLEKRFLEPFAERLFGDYPDLDYELDRIKNKLPANIEIFEFYYPPGKYLRNPKAQQNYISSNYTHIARDIISFGVNVMVQQVSKGVHRGQDKLSLSCNADVALDVIPKMNEMDFPTMSIGQVNNRLPFMYGKAIVPMDFYDELIEDPSLEYDLFAPPKMYVGDADFMVGLYVSSLIKDDGELQVGIGSMGDAVIYGLLVRHEKNDQFKAIIKHLRIDEKFPGLIDKEGGIEPFDKGLLGATEMFVDGFMQLFEAGILKRKVYDHVALQRALNEEALSETIDKDFIQTMFDRNMVHNPINQIDFDFLHHFGILKEGIEFSQLQNKIEKSDWDKFFQLNHPLEHGAVIHAGFFLGCKAFYKWLKHLPEEKLKLINMTSVQFVNQLYRNEEIDRLHMKNARFVNTCLKVSLSGAVASDGIEDGRVISGVGGQYNFVAMAHELEGARSIINLRSTRGSGKTLESNIVYNYGHTTIPRHLRDIVITEYGIADLRGKTDSQVAKALINIADSRFQLELLKKAQKIGKVEKGYKVPEEFKNNLPHHYEKFLKQFKDKGLFSSFPLGTDFTPIELKIGKALKRLKKESANKVKFLPTMFKAYSTNLDTSKHKEELERMNLFKPRGFKEKLYQRLLLEYLD